MGERLQGAWRESRPNTAKEFLSYEYESNKDGQFVNGFPDKNNHSIDAVRYGMFPVWRRRSRDTALSAH